MPDITTITIRPNGSLKVEGPFRLIDSVGNDMPVDKPVISLCRCGQSANKPFCDGTHKTCGFNGLEAHLAAQIPETEKV
jgi:CDGSH-type Zn-finger protein